MFGTQIAIVVVIARPNNSIHWSTSDLFQTCDAVAKMRKHWLAVVNLLQSPIPTGQPEAYESDMEFHVCPLI